MKSLMILLVIVSSAHAQWQLNGIAVLDTSIQGAGTAIPHIAPDGEGGAYVCWADRRANNYDIYAQRVDSAGNILWQRNGIPVVVAPQRQAPMKIINDGFGNAIIAWEDDRGSDTYVYAQKIDKLGQLLWQTNGVKVAEVPGLYVRVVATGDGGAAIAWNLVDGVNDDVVVQRLNSFGSRMRGDSGVRVTNRPPAVYQGDVWITTDGQRGAIVSWGEGYRVYAQRVDSSGVVRWQTNGVLLSDTISPNISVACATDGHGGAIVNWAVDTDRGNGFAQRVDSNGTVRWTLGGILLGSSGGGGGQRNTGDDAGGAIVGHGLFIQHVNRRGTKLWQSSGVPYTTLPSIESTQARTGEGGVMNFCKSFVENQGLFLFRQWIDRTGIARWGTNGIRLLSFNSTQRFAQATEDGRGNCLVTWEDYRRGYFGVFVAKVDTNGIVTSVGEPRNTMLPRVPNLDQNYPNPFNGNTIIRYYLPMESFVTIKVSDILGREVQSLLHERQTQGEHSISFDGKNLPSAVYFYRLITQQATVTKKMLLLR